MINDVDLDVPDTLVAPLLGGAAALLANGVEVVATRLVVDDETLGASVPLLSADERERASRFAFERDRRRFIVGRARLRQLLAERLDARPESIALVYGARGKPAIVRSSREPDVRFNMSHCDDVAVYGLSSGREIGVDVEAIRPLREADDIAARFFSPRENVAYRALAPGERSEGFFNCWTRKEAFIKALGEGLSFPLDRFDVSLAPGEPAKILHVAGTDGDECGWTMESFSPAPGFVAAVVVEKSIASAAGARTISS